MTLAPTIRPATIDDLPAIASIYSHYVLHSTATYQTEPWTVEQQIGWFNAHESKHPITVATINNQIVAWGSLSRFHPRSAYATTVENSIYVSHDRLRQGIGQAIMNDLIARARSLGHHAIIALIDAEQTGSIIMHEKSGFQKAGHLRQVGYKFDRWLDVIYMELMLG